MLRRFGREAQILGRLHSPGIAQIYEAGWAVDGRPYPEQVGGLPHALTIRSDVYSLGVILFELLSNRRP